VSKSRMRSMTPPRGTPVSMSRYSDRYSSTCSGAIMPAAMALSGTFTMRAGAVR